MIKFDYSHACSKNEILAYQDRVNKCHKDIIEKTGKGNDFLGWVDWCENYDREEFEEIKKHAEHVREICNVFVVCGTGGSYLGARAAIEMINGLYADKGPEVIFIGNTFSSTYITQVMKYLENKEVCVNIISKSGTTTEPAVAFRILKQFMERKYGKDGAKKRIFATTDKSRGTLYDLSVKEGYKMFVVPDDIGGRYSVITAVGLFPIAVAGINIDDVMSGVKKAYNYLKSPKLEENPAYEYAVARRVLEDNGKGVEMLITYDFHTQMLTEWWKQLFGESEGKDKKGILPCNATFSTDLHSFGQFIQDGKHNLFETIINFEKPVEDMLFPDDEENLDGMNYLSGKSIDWMNKMTMQGTLEAHVCTGKVPNLIITAEDMGAETFGYICYFFFRACAMTCYLIDINPFNQPGVEIYKKNMFRLLGRE